MNPPPTHMLGQPCTTLILYLLIQKYILQLLTPCCNPNTTAKTYMLTMPCIDLLSCITKVLSPYVEDNDIHDGKHQEHHTNTHQTTHNQRRSFQQVRSITPLKPCLNTQSQIKVVDQPAPTARTNKPGKQTSQQTAATTESKYVF